MERWLVREREGDLLKIFQGQNAYYVSFLNFRPDLMNSVYSMPFFGTKKPVISNKEMRENRGSPSGKLTQAFNNTNISY